MRKQNLVLRKLLQERKIHVNRLTRQDRIKTTDIQNLLRERDLRIKHRRSLQSLHEESRKLTNARLQSYIQERTRLLENNQILSREWEELDRQLNRVESQQKELKQTWDSHMKDCNNSYAMEKRTKINTCQ